MGKPIVPVAFGVLGLIGVIVCCAVPQWVVLYGNLPKNETGKLVQYGLWKQCALYINECQDFVPASSALHAIKAMTVISCLLTCLSLLSLLTQSFNGNCIPYLQNEDAKPKIYLVVGMGLLLAGLLVIISVIWFPHALEQFLKFYLDGGSQSIVPVKGACVYVGWVAGVLLLLDGGLLCFFR